MIFTISDVSQWDDRKQKRADDNVYPSSLMCWMVRYGLQLMDRKYTSLQSLFIIVMAFELHDINRILLFADLIDNSIMCRNTS